MHRNLANGNCRWLGEAGNSNEYNVCKTSLRSWRYCVGARLKFWLRSRVPKKGSRDEAVEIAARDGSAVKSHSTILQRLRRQISLDYYTIPPATQANAKRTVRIFSVSPQSRSLFSASFDCSRVLEYAKIRTVLQSRGGTSATQRQKFHTDDANQCLHNRSGSHGVPNINLSNFTCLLVDFGKVLCSSTNKLQQNSNASS